MVFTTLKIRTSRKTDDRKWPCATHSLMVGRRMSGNSNRFVEQIADDSLSLLYLYQAKAYLADPSAFAAAAPAAAEASNEAAPAAAAKEEKKEEEAEESDDDMGFGLFD